MLAVRHGDLQAFDELADRYYGYVQSTISYLMGSNASSADLSQEVFLRVFRARDRYVPKSKFSTWLFTIVNNVVSNAKQRHCWRPLITLPKCHRQHASAFASQVDVRASPSDVLLRGERHQMLFSAMSRLNDRQSEAISLYYLKGLGHEAIATEMNTSRNAVKSMLHRARLRLCELLTPYEHDGEAVKEL